jgi:hypothetical protein
MTSTTYPIPEVRQFFTDPERYTEPIEDLAEAEEEEFVELWAGDTGNQGA